MTNSINTEHATWTRSLTQAEFKELYRQLRLARGMTRQAMQNLPCGADDALAEQAEANEEVFIENNPSVAPASKRWDTGVLEDRASDYANRRFPTDNWWTLPNCSQCAFTVDANGEVNTFATVFTATK